MNRRKVAMIAAAVLGLLALLYLGGLLGQFLTSYQSWLAHDGLTGGIMDYRSVQVAAPTTLPQRELAPQNPEKKEAKPGLYSSAKPPTDF